LTSRLTHLKIENNYDETHSLPPSVKILEINVNDTNFISVPHVEILKLKINVRDTKIESDSLKKIILVKAEEIRNIRSYPSGCILVDYYGNRLSP
jgi:hypothetical protein